MPFLDDINVAREKVPAGRVSRPVLLGIASFAVIVAILAALGVASSARGDFVVGNTTSSSSAAIEGAQEGEVASQTIASSSTHENPCIYVVGAVKKPGVYTLDVGARVTDAIEAAGGFKKNADTIAVNLARPVSDGEQITIPEQGEAQAEAQTVRGGTSGTVSNQTAGVMADGKININSAIASELEALPGIGQVTAEKIVANREAEGPFASPEDLKRVSGIGEKKYDAIADLITV